MDAMQRRTLLGMGFASLLSMKTTERMPALFVGHGSPTSAISPNLWTRAWSDIGSHVPRPNAILSISAHWITNGGMLVTASPRPQMNYDMGGFPPEMYQLKYPAPGNPALAKEIESSLQKTIPVRGDSTWGFDHGTWLILRYMFPKADIPLIQLSIDYSKPPAFHFDLARQLQPLRDKGVLIVGSGNIVHNLREMVRTDVKPFDWAVEFDRRMDENIQQGNYNGCSRLSETRHSRHHRTSDLRSFPAATVCAGAADKGRTGPHAHQRFSVQIRFDALVPGRVVFPLILPAISNSNRGGDSSPGLHWRPCGLLKILCATIETAWGLSLVPHR
jgi:4,5-DOPA dioxygenase extradiol